MSFTNSIMMRFNGYILRFTLRKFTIVSGLNCVASKLEFVFDIIMTNRLLQMYFGGEEKPPTIVFL